MHSGVHPQAHLPIAHFTGKKTEAESKLEPGTSGRQREAAPPFSRKHIPSGDPSGHSAKWQRVRGDPGGTRGRPWGGRGDGCRHPGSPESWAGSTWWAPTSWDAQPQGGLFWGGPRQAGSGRVGLEWAPGRHGMEAGGAPGVQARPCAGPGPAPECRRPGSLPLAQQGGAPASVHVWTPRWRLRCPHPRGVEASVRPSHSTARGGGLQAGAGGSLSSHMCTYTGVRTLVSQWGLTEKGCVTAGRGRGPDAPCTLPPRRPGFQKTAGRPLSLPLWPTAPGRSPCGIVPSTQTDSVPWGPWPA